VPNLGAKANRLKAGGLNPVMENQLRRIALCEGQGLVGERGVDERLLALHQFIDVPGQRGPLSLGQVEMAAQVEQRGLLDGAADARGLNETEGRVRLA
jgi:hypothetical protein